jgi:hypothetical protein
MIYEVLVFSRGDYYGEIVNSATRVEYLKFWVNICL